MKGFFAKLKDFSPKLKVSEILLCLLQQHRWKKPVVYVLPVFFKRKHQKKWVFDYTWQRPLSIEPVDGECICRGGVGRRIFRLVHSQWKGYPGWTWKRSSVCPLRSWSVPGVRPQPGWRRSARRWRPPTIAKHQRHKLCYLPGVVRDTSLFLLLSNKFT